LAALDGFIDPTSKALIRGHELFAITVHTLILSKRSARRRNRERPRGTSRVGQAAAARRRAGRAPPLPPSKQRGSLALGGRWLSSWNGSISGGIHASDALGSPARATAWTAVDEMSELDDVHNSPSNGSAVGMRTPLMLQTSSARGFNRRGPHCCR
jgi:hypothetical protein